jgi:hypothetical protein
MFRRSVPRCHALLLAAASATSLAWFAAGPASAQSFTCTDSFRAPSGSWDNTGNWTTGIPSPSSNSCIGANGVTVTSAGTDNTYDLFIGSGDTLNNSQGGVYVYGTKVDNDGSIALNGALLRFSQNATLDGGGTIQMTGGLVGQQGSNVTLDNVNNLIIGTGIVGFNGLSLVNEAQGTVIASGGALSLNGGGSITNYGTLEVAAGATMHLSGGAFENFSGNTLTGGTYEVSSTNTRAGVLLIEQLGTSGGEIVNNDASILLSGANSNFVDANGNNALSNFSRNESGGSFTIISGRNFATADAGNFINAGNVTIGATSKMSIGSAAQNNYVQSGGTTQVDGTLAANNASINGGTLQGTGNLTLNALMNYGVVKPGDATGSPGTLSITGNFGQGSTGTLDIEIGGTHSGQYGQLDISGTANLGGTLAVNLVKSFSLAMGEKFDILNAGVDLGDFSAFDFDGQGCTSGPGDTWHCAGMGSMYFAENFLRGGNELELDVVPEPGSLLLFGAGLLGMACFAFRRSQKTI